MSVGKLCVSLLVIATVVVFSRSQVLGIDFGTEFWKASLISPGRNLAIVQNSRSERKTFNAISFHEGVRYFQSQSLAKRLRKPQSSHFYLNRLIRSLDNQPTKDYPFQNGTYIIRQDDYEMTLEQVVGMILRDLKNHAGKQAGSDIKDCVIAIPANWGPKAKMSLINAAYLAEMSVLGLINENSAAIINFAITRNDTEPVNMVLFNLGSSNLQISVIKLFGFMDENKGKNIQSVEVLGHYVVDDVGGLAVDQHIANYLAQQFKKKHKIDPRDKPKSWAKLLHKSADAKEVLSANKETTVYIEGLIDGIDMQINVKREIIEKMDIFNQFTNYLQKALQKASVSKQDIQFVELIGGGSRVPRVINLIKEFFAPSEVGTHMNADESMAFGSALRAANLSIALKVKQLHFYDGHDFDTRVVISSAESGVIHQGVIFTKADQHGAKNNLVLSKNDQDLKISIYKGEDELIRQYTTSGISNWKEKYQNESKTAQPTVIINFVSSSVTIAEVKEIFVNVTLNVSETKEVVEYVQEEVEVGENQQAKQQKQEKGNKQSEDGDKKEEDKEDQKEEIKEQTQQAQNQTSGEDSKKKAKKEKKTKTVKKQVEQFREVSKKHTIKLQQTFVKYPKFSKEDIEEKKQIIKRFESHEQQLKQKSKIRNQFEGTLYAIKDNLGTEFMKNFSQEKELETLKKVVTRQIQWMEQNAWTGSKNDFQTHFKLLYVVYEPIYNRTLQYQDRSKYYNQTMNILSSAYSKTEDLNSTNEWLGNKILKHLQKINNTVAEINEKMKKQVDMPLNESPIILNHQMLEKADKIREEYYLLRMIPRPKKVKQTPKEEVKKDDVDQTVDLDDDEQYQEDKEVTSNQDDNDNVDVTNQDEQDLGTEGIEDNDQGQNSRPQDENESNGQKQEEDL